MLKVFFLMTTLNSALVSSRYFPNSLNSLFSSPGAPPYNSPERELVRFYLYSNKRNKDSKEELIPWDEPSITSSNYNPSYPIKIVIHGYMDNHTGDFPQKSKNAYLETDYPANIVLVDWGGRAQPRLGLIRDLTKGYPKASKFTWKAGERVAQFLTFLMETERLIHPSAVHLIGFSLGAHVAGVAGHIFKKNTHLPLGRITGLDPAGINYHFVRNEQRLDKEDAEFVDVTHTNQGIYGFLGKMGHADFYPNGGGPFQPGCKVPIDSIDDLPGVPSSCPHCRAWKYFIKSIYNGDITACRDKSYIHFKLRKKCTHPVVYGEFTSAMGGNYYFDMPYPTIAFVPTRGKKRSKSSRTLYKG